jgi:hypothetical protein
MQTERRLETSRLIAAPAAAVFAVLCDPQGHVAIDSSGMLQDATGSPVTAAGDSFVVHMDRESLGDYPEMGRYDVRIEIRNLEPDREISWYVRSALDIGHFYGYHLDPQDDTHTLVTSYYDWSEVSADWLPIFPIIPESALKATLGILERTVRRGYR